MCTKTPFIYFSWVFFSTFLFVVYFFDSFVHLRQWQWRFPSIVVVLIVVFPFFIDSTKTQTNWIKSAFCSLGFHRFFIVERSEFLCWSCVKSAFNVVEPIDRQNERKSARPQRRYSVDLEVHRCLLFDWQAVNAKQSDHFQIVSERRMNETRDATRRWLQGLHDYFD